MKINFINFINENKSDDDFENFLGDIKVELHAFKNTSAQADEFIKMYYDSLKKSFEDGFTVREAIAATKIPGKKIDDKKVTESFIFNIDDDFEILYDKIENIKTYEDLDKGYKNIENYFNEFDNINYSDVRLYERFRNNYKTLIKLYNDKNEV